MSDDIEQKVRDVVVEQLGADASKVTPASSFINDLGADSLDTVELVMALEEVFGLQIPDADAEKIHTVGNAVEYIKANKK